MIYHKNQEICFNVDWQKLRRECYGRMSDDSERRSDTFFKGYEIGIAVIQAIFDNWADGTVSATKK